MTRNRTERLGVRLLVAISAALMLFGAGCGSSAPEVPAESTAPQKPGPQASPAKPALVIHSEVGFAARRRFLEHYEKHGAEFGSISKEDYLRQAQILRDRPAGGDILEVTRADGVVTRFNRKTGAFLAFNPDLTIRTYFKPNDGERYFIRQSKRRP